MKHPPRKRTGPPRARTPSGEVESALLDAAERLLDREGPSALSVRRISREAGVAPMGIYNRFDGKNGIVDALFRRGFQTLVDGMADMASEADPIEALRIGGLRYREVALRHPTTYTVMFMSAVPGFEPSEESHEVAGEAFDAVVRTVARGIQAGAVRDEDPMVIAMQLWATVHGAVALELAGIGFCEDHDALFADLLATLMRGFAPDPA